MMDNTEYYNDLMNSKVVVIVEELRLSDRS